MKRPIVSRRGSAAVAVLIVMLLLIVVIASIVMSGAGDPALIERKIEGVRAFYAAEAGANMAVRELMLGEDEDGDGGVGTISDDGDPATNPTLPGASFFVAASVDEEIVTLESRGRSGEAFRTAQIATYVPQPIAMIAYGREGMQQPAFRLWDDDSSAWSAEGLANAIGDVPFWIVVRGDPRSRRFALAALGNDSRITVQIWEPQTGWSAPFVATSNTGLKDMRVFDIAFEPLSGRLLLVYRASAGSSSVRYRTWQDGVWSSEQTYNLVPQVARWLQLVPKTGTNEMFLVGSNAAGGKQTRVALWDGSSFGNRVQFTTDAPESEHFAVAWETISGNAISTYNADAVDLGYRTHGDSGWSPPQDAPPIASEPYWTRLASSPVSNQAIMGVLDKDKRIHVNTWSGGWASNFLVESNAGDNNRRGFDIAYMPGLNAALLVYDGNSNTLRYRTWNGSAWSAAQSGPTGGSAPLWTIQAVPAPGSEANRIFVTWKTDTPEIRTAVWNGSSFGPVVVFGKSSAPKEYETFMAAVANDVPVTTVIAWNEAAP